jgi:hypothetical protein
VLQVRKRQVTALVAGWATRKQSVLFMFKRITEEKNMSRTASVELGRLPRSTSRPALVNARAYPLESSLQGTAPEKGTAMSSLHAHADFDDGAARVTGNVVGFPRAAKRLFSSYSAPSLAATVAVLELARKIESSTFEAIAWYRNVPIAELGNLTAIKLVAQGDAESVVAFLKSIDRGDRG